MGKQRTFFWDTTGVFDELKPLKPLKSAVQTSVTHPLHVDWMPKDVLGTKGRVGMTSAPGKCHENGITAVHRRSMDVDLKVLTAKHTNMLVTLMEPLELMDNSMGGLAVELEKRGIKWLHFPIRDLSIPTSLRGLRAAVVDVFEQVTAGRHVVVHCRGGHGRTGLFVACLLTEFGHDAGSAIKLVRAARKGTIHNDAQADFVHLYANERE